MLDLLRAGQGVESWVPTGEVAQLELAGTPVVVAVDRNKVEGQRRQVAGLGSIEDRRALDVLLSMPGDASVPWSLFAPWQQRVLRALPAGVVERSGSQVRRMLKPPVSVLSAGFLASSWEQGFRRSAVLASHCARYVVVDSPKDPGGLVVEALEARYYGIGLAAVRRGRLDWLVSPAPFEAEWFSASAWQMAEHVWAALRAHGPDQ